MQKKNRRSSTTTAPALLLRGLKWVKFTLARVYRAGLGLLGRPCFVGITGSCGKTLTKELIAAILATRSRCRKSNKLMNGPMPVAETILTTFPWHRYCVHEIASGGPGTLIRSMKVLHPHVGVVTHVNRDHFTRFRSLEATAAEKAVMVECLPPEGTALLNADDPYVLAMRDRTKAHVVTYGFSPEATVRAEDVTSIWPARLSLTAVYGDERERVRTLLLGEHWAHAVLASLATVLAMGVPLQDAARAIETVEPVEGRMSPHETSDGIIFIRDDWKAPLWTIAASLQFMSTAHARRKVVVIGTISDYPGDSARKYRSVARQALEVADKVLFVGQMAHCAIRVRSHPDDDRVMAFDSLYDLELFLREYLAQGDLVLLKGSSRADHLQRLVLSRTGENACWRESCRKFIFCGDCRLRKKAYVPLAEER